MWVCNKCGKEFNKPNLSKGHAYTEKRWENCPYCSSIDIERLKEEI